MKNPRHFPYLFRCFFLCAIVTFAFVRGASQEGRFRLDDGQALPLTPAGFAWVNELFDAEAPLELKLTAGFRELQGQGEETEYQPGTLEVYPGDNTLMRVNIRLKPRGYSRRQVCEFTPLKLDFSHKGTELKEVKTLQELKLVSHCREGESFEHFLLREYLVYRLYNLLTPYSFRVRLARIRYVEAGETEPFYTAFAFLIEEVDKLARRNGAVEVDDTQLLPEQTDRRQITLVSVFQFMIANFDWSVNNLHNIKLLRRPGVADPLPVPYDFDFSGFVDALYAEPVAPGAEPMPAPGRVFQGHCRTPEEFEDVFRGFRDQREPMIRLVRSFPYFTDEEKEGLVSYLQSFFRVIDSPQQVELYFVRNCRK